MNHVIEITDIRQTEAQIFSCLTEAQLCDHMQRGYGLFIAESPKVINVALDAGYEAVALLCERRHLTGDAAALGIDGAILSSNACDPLNRRAARVSMGSVFLLPWTISDDAAGEARMAGFKTVAMALRNDSVAITDERLKAEPRLAIMMGTEGDGLAYDTIKRADYTVRIPMYHGVDSLNVAAASAVAFWELASH